MSERTSKKDAEENDSWAGSFYIPQKKEQWAALRKAGKLKDATINSIKKMASGSKVLRRQFVMFRAIWPYPIYPAEFLNNMNNYGLDSTYDEAVEIIESSAEFTKFLKLVGAKVKSDTITENDPRWAGSLMPAYRFQEACLDRIPDPGISTDRGTKRKSRGPIPWSEYGTEGIDREKFQSADEAIVNVALLLLLQAITSISGKHKVTWSIKRVSFSLKFSNARFTTITDGALMDKKGGKVRAICEVKKHQLDHTMQSKTAITMQESAELVGLIKENDSPIFLQGHYLLTSQYANELYLMFAKAPETYKGYLDAGVIDANDFLVIQRCGPWFINSRRSLKQLAIIILAIVLLADQAQLAG